MNRYGRENVVPKSPEWICDELRNASQMGQKGLGGSIGARIREGV
jgi:hypothetical protein